VIYLLGECAGQNRLDEKSRRARDGRLRSFLLYRIKHSSDNFFSLDVLTLPFDKFQLIGSFTLATVHFLFRSFFCLLDKLPQFTVVLPKLEQPTLKMITIGLLVKNIN